MISFLAPSRTLQKQCLIPEPNLPFPFFQQNPQKNQIKSLQLIPSLRSVENLGISSLIDYLLLRLTQREPSPVLVGLATRLRMV